MIQQVMFLILAAVTLGGAIGVVTSRSVFVSALWLILAFVGVAGLYVLLDAGFMAVIQVLVYVGAVSVLILFAIMLTKDIMTDRRTSNAQSAAAAVIAVALFGGLVVLGYRGPWQLNEAAVVPPAGAVVAQESDPSTVPGAVASVDEQSATRVAVTGTTATLGRSFVSDYLLAFEVAGAILLVALIGAIVIARE